MEVYLDYSSTTPIEPRVLMAMRPYLTTKYGNPSSLHNKGKEARDAVEKARKQIADVLNCSPEEIIFTSGGTEANNLAIHGIVNHMSTFSHNCEKTLTRNRKAIKERILQKKPHIITTKIEHPSVLEVCKYLEKENWADITYLDLNKYGIVDLKQLEKSLCSETVLVSIIYANNEIGVVQDIKRIAYITKNSKFQIPNSPIFHTDACQAGEYLTLDVEKLGVDLMTINSSKIYGPKGVGALYIKKGIKIAPIFLGGHQERGLRPGTENVAGIVGFGEALRTAKNLKFNPVLFSKRTGQNSKLKKLRDYFLKELFRKIPKIRLNGHRTKRLPNNVNISILDVEGESLILYLNEKGVYCSTGSACASGSLEPSHVIMALGVPYEVAYGSLRFTLGRKTTKKDIDYVLKVLPPIVEKLRKISPVKIKKWN